MIVTGSPSDPSNPSLANDAETDKPGAVDPYTGC